MDTSTSESISECSLTVWTIRKAKSGWVISIPIRVRWTNINTCIINSL